MNNRFKKHASVAVNIRMSLRNDYENAMFVSNRGLIVAIKSLFREFPITGVTVEDELVDEGT